MSALTAPVSTTTTSTASTCSFSPLTFFSTLATVQTMCVPAPSQRTGLPLSLMSARSWSPTLMTLRSCSSMSTWCSAGMSTTRARAS
ncbi:MAG: hypothetical protein Q8O67_29515 [Deltaproteobacteria bacterium]|nr:hypothetical protein [Deltaproteobacteria bacterium]